MGAILAVASAACCGCSALASCFSCFKKCQPEEDSHHDTRSVSVMTRVFYALFLLVGLVIAFVLKHSNQILSKIPYASKFCDEQGSEISSLCRGTFAIDRVSFCLAIFFLIHLLLSFRCCGPPSFRLAFQSSLFCIKFVLFVLFAFVSFFIPNDFFVGYSYVAAVGATVFLIVQVFVLLDFAFVWNDSWTAKMVEATDDAESKSWTALLMAAALVVHLLGLALIIVCYVFFHTETVNVAMVTLTLCVGLILSATALKVERGSVLVSGVIFIYGAYLTFSALSSGAQSCVNANEVAPLPPDHAPLLLLPPKPVSLGPLQDFPPTVALVLSIVIAALSLMWATVSAGGSSRAFSMGKDEDAEVGTPLLSEEEEVLTTSHFTYFHFVMMTASMYMAMLLTSWAVGQQSPSSPDCVDSGHTVMWVKFASLWLTQILYFWTLIAPVLCPGRFEN